MLSLLKRSLARLTQSGITRWAAPVRTLRQACGWRPKIVPLSKARRILLIRPDEIGDVVLTSPLLRELRRAAPQAKITLLVKPACYELVRHCPYVDSVWMLDFAPKYGVLNRRMQWCWNAWRLRFFRNGGHGFDLVLCPRRAADWYDAEFAGHLLAGHGALLVHRETVVKNSVPPADRVEVPVVVFSNPVIEHEVLHNLLILRCCGAETGPDLKLELWPAPADRTFACDWLAKHFPRRKRLVVMHPSGGRSALKQWPVENFREVLRRLERDTDADFLIMAGGDEGWIAKEFSGLVSDRIKISSGELSLRQLGAVLETAALFIGGDSGPMHLAAAAGIRVLGVLGPTSRARFHPWGKNARTISLDYPCSPDALRTYEDRCMTCRFEKPLCLWELGVEMVASAARELLQAGESGQGGQPATEALTE